MDPCKALLTSINALQKSALEKSGDEREQAATVAELERSKKLYAGICALARQTLAILDGTVTMITDVPDFRQMTVDLGLKLAFNPSHTGVNPLRAVLIDPRGRAQAVLSEAGALGAFEKKSGRLTLPASLHVDYMQSLGGLSSLVLSTDSSNELGHGSRMDGKGNVRLAGSGTFESGRWERNTFSLLVAGTVTPVP